MPKPKVAIICTGLGHIERGYESFFGECFRALRQDETLDFTVYKGFGHSDSSEVVIPCLRRSEHAARSVARCIEPLYALFNRTGNPARYKPYHVEQASFFLGLLPRLLNQPPDLIYIGDRFLTELLWRARAVIKRPYKLLFHNGAPADPPFSFCDQVQQLTPVNYSRAVANGEPRSKHCLLPLACEIEAEFKVPSPEEKSRLRATLGIPANRPVLLTVGSIDASHKRMDYLISEVKQAASDAFLLMVGQQDWQAGGETSYIARLADVGLAPDAYLIKTVPFKEMSNYYRASDYFVLASLKEGFGRAFVEAMSTGLPCMAHDYEVNRFILGDFGLFADFTEPGALAALLPKAAAQVDNASATARYRSVYERFSWHALKNQYLSMIQNCLS